MRVPANLVLAGAALLAALGPAPAPALATTHARSGVAALRATGSRLIGSEVIGHSVDGRPIIAYHLGNPKVRRVSLVIGQMHGDEPAGPRVVRALLRSPHQLTGVNLWVIPTVNPDGAAAHTRQNAHGVDLNRNFPYHWTRMTGMFDSGPHALSEPEVRAVRAFLLRIRPHYIVSIHQPLDGVDTTDGGRVDPAFRRLLARSLGLPQKPFRCNSTCRGSMTGWYTAAHLGVAITVEFGSSPSRAYLTGRARVGIVHAFGGHYVA